MSLINFFALLILWALTISFIGSLTYRDFRNIRFNFHIYFSFVYLLTFLLGFPFTFALVFGLHIAAHRQVVIVGGNGFKSDGLSKVRYVLFAVEHLHDLFNMRL